MSQGHGTKAVIRQTVRLMVPLFGSDDVIGDNVVQKLVA